MSTEAYRCEINASFDDLWKVLMDEAEHPQNYSQTIQDCRVLERFHDGILRTVRVPDADVRERVVFDYDKGTITSSLVGHPQLVGEIIKTIERTSEQGKQVLVSKLEWKSIDKDIDSMVQRNIETFATDGLAKVRQKAEGQ